LGTILRKLGAFCLNNLVTLKGPPIFKAENLDKMGSLIHWKIQPYSFLADNMHFVYLLVLEPWVDAVTHCYAQTVAKFLTSITSLAVLAGKLWRHW